MLLFGVVCSLAPAVFAGGRPEVPLFELLPGFELSLRLEPLGMLFALVASGLWIATAFYSIGYMRAHHEQHQTRFYFCFAVAMFAALGAALAGEPVYAVRLLRDPDALDLSVGDPSRHAGGLPRGADLSGHSAVHLGGACCCWP